MVSQGFHSSVHDVRSIVVSKDTVINSMIQPVEGGVMHSSACSSDHVVSMIDVVVVEVVVMEGG